MDLDPEVRDLITRTLISLALADHLGDVRDSERYLWKILEIPELPFSDPAWDDEGGVYTITAARLKAAAIPFPPEWGDGS